MNRTQTASLAEKIADFAMLCTEGNDRDAVQALRMAPMFFDLGQLGENSSESLTAEFIMSEVQMYANLDYLSAGALRKAIGDILSAQPRPIVLSPGEVVAIAQSYPTSAVPLR